jgi:hypothetical protein
MERPRSTGARHTAKRAWNSNKAKVKARQDKSFQVFQTELGLEKDGFPKDEIEAAQTRSIRCHGIYSDNKQWLRKQILLARKRNRVQDIGRDEKQEDLVHRNVTSAKHSMNEKDEALRQQREHDEHIAREGRQIAEAVESENLRRRSVEAANESRRKFRDQHAEIKQTSLEHQAEHSRRYPQQTTRQIITPMRMMETMAPTKTESPLPSMHVQDGCDALAHANGLYLPDGYYRGWPRWMHKASEKLWIRRCPGRPLQPAHDECWVLCNARTDLSHHGYLQYAHILAQCPAVDTSYPSSSYHTWCQSTQHGGRADDGARLMSVQTVPDDAPDEDARALVAPHGEATQHTSPRLESAAAAVNPVVSRWQPTAGKRIWRSGYANEYVDSVISSASAGERKILSTRAGLRHEVA